MRAIKSTGDYSVRVTDPGTRDEAGSPNTVGAVAQAAAIRALQKLGMDAVAEHEASLTRYALQEMAAVPGLKIYGSTAPEEAAGRLGVIPFSIEGFSHILVTAILGYEYGIGARNGRFCAYPYTFEILGLRPEEKTAANQRIARGEAADIPGLVRVSFGLYNTREDVDVLVEALNCIAKHEYRGVYEQDPRSGDFIPSGWQVDFDSYFSLG